MYFRDRKRLGLLLVEAGLISGEQLAAALENHGQTRQRLGKILVNQGLVGGNGVSKVLARQLGLDYLDLEQVVIPGEIARLVPEAMAQWHKVIPVGRTAEKVILAMADPLDVFAMDDVRLVTGLDVEPVVATEDGIEEAIARYFAFQESVEEIIRDFRQERFGDGDDPLGVEGLRAMVEDAPVVKFVNSFIIRAVLNRASDIHVEPGEKEVRVRYRIDGRLFDLMQSPKAMQAPVVSRLKIMAGLDIAERRLPQDGRIKLKIENKEVDLRVSTMSTIFGEKVVLRILDKSRGLLTLGELGLSEENYRNFQRIIHKPHGLLLVTGPTGSGKTTTLYAVLNHLNAPEKNLITLEDPVEYTLAGVNQVQLNTKAGLSFAGGLRSVLRQDPDIIMVGEIRDGETARIAIQSAMTGHQVLSTLHTNNAASALARLLDMGIEPFLVASSVIGVMAQRLVRSLCPNCKEPVELSSGILAGMGLEGTGFKACRARGCPLCNHTGYKGRVALHEMLLLDNELRELVNNKAPTGLVEEIAGKKGLKSLKQDGISKVAQGLTSLEEIMGAVYIEESL
ncbi:MAG: ATPase, T2SS/T4P/T4SS family [Clostridia bacterium]|nr:ATPase, T2SS/T4P/T4SS family [Clostridia bacterium]